MSINLPHQSMMPSISSITLDGPKDNPGDDPDGPDGETADIPLTPERVEKVKEEEANDDASESIEEVLNDDFHLPKDVGEINVKGHLHFDEEMPPDETTQNNTMHNAMMYQLHDDRDDHRDHIHHHHHHDHAEHEHEREEKEHDDRSGKRSIMFDTYSPNQDVSHYQMTIVHEDKHFHYRNTTRTFLVPYDDEKPSADALAWTFTEMAADNDIVIVLKVVSLQHVMKYGVQSHRKDCQNLFKMVCKCNEERRKLKVVVEIRIGSVEYSLARALKDFDPTFMVMGTRGIRKAKLTSFLNEDPSMTKHFLDDGWVPVIVLNPNYVHGKVAAAATAAAAATPAKNTFRNFLTSYPSVYDPLVAGQTLEMERSVSGESGTSSGAGRTSRFLRIGRSMSRSSSINRHNNSNDSPGGTLSPTTSNDLSPGRALSPRRALSPFRLFHNSRHGQG